MLNILTRISNGSLSLFILKVLKGVAEAYEHCIMEM
jgi:hypothetical protein